MEFDFDSPDGGDAWLLDAMATSLHFSAASPPLPLPPPWPCGDPHHPSVVPLDTAAPQDDAPGARAGEVSSTIDFAAVPSFTAPCRTGRSGRGSCCDRDRKSDVLIRLLVRHAGD